jgi:hypothetical protein
MQLANVHLRVNQWSFVPRERVTPAESIVLRKLFAVKLSDEIGGYTNPFEHFDLLEETSKKSKGEEYKRLCRVYGEKVTKECFPGESVDIIPDEFPKDESGKIVFETDFKQPKMGKPQEILPLSKIPRGLTPQEQAEYDKSEQHIVKIDKTQEQISQLTQQIALLTSIVASQVKPIEPVALVEPPKDDLSTPL